MVDFDTAPLARDLDGSAVFLRELWPADDEVEEIVRKHVRPEFFAGRNKTLWLGTEHWRQLDGKVGIRYAWEDSSTYLRRPAYTHGISLGKPGSIDIRGARPLLVLSDNVTTDHISPAGTIPPSSAAGKWLLDRGEKSEDLNQYSTRRSNHEVMLRGAFTTPNLKNLLLGEEHPTGKGAYARSADCGSILPVFDAAATYACPLVIFAGINYGAGSSRDWAAKAPALLGVRAIAARSFERIHRSNLIGMGIFPLVLPEGLDLQGLITTGREVLDFIGLDAIRVGRQEIFVSIQNGGSIAASLQIDSDQELAYLRHGGILPYVVRKALH